MVARVPPPDNQRARYGLASVADVRTDTTGTTPPSDRWQIDGADWETPWCSDAFVWPGDCPPDGQPAPEPLPVTITVNATPAGSPGQVELAAAGSIPSGHDNRTVTVRVDGQAARQLTATPGGGTSVTLGSVTLPGWGVDVALTAEADPGSGAPPAQAIITGTATLTNGTVPRDVTVKIGSGEPVTLTTGAAGKPVATVAIPRRTITTTVTATDAGDVTASAAVSGGPARTVLVTVGTLDPVQVTTGDPAATVGNLAAGDYPVETVDDATNESASGTLTITDTGGTVDVPLQVPYEQSHTATVVDVASGVTADGNVTVAVDGTGNTTVSVAGVDAGTVPVSARDAASGGTARGLLRIAADRTGTAQLVIQVNQGPAKPVPPGREYGHTGRPFTVYAGVDCFQGGIGDPTDTARARLRAAEWRTVEQRYWTEQLAPQADDLTPAGSDLPEITDAVAILEQAIADRYTGVGTIHSTRGTWSYAKSHVDKSDPDGGGDTLADLPLLRTELWTRWAFGLGYPGTGPDGAQPDPGTTWLYATGAVLVRRGPILVPATPSTGAFDPTTNRSTVRAERVYTVGHDCFAVAVHARLTTIPITNSPEAQG